jgi:hypothetical protein
MMTFDTYNKRFEVNDPKMITLPGRYGLGLAFDTPGGNLYDYPLTVSSPFPTGTVSYTWTKAPSPISNASGPRFSPHTIFGILIKKEILTSKYEEIGFDAYLWYSVDNIDDIIDPLGLLTSAADFAKFSFKSYPVPETPWPEIALIGTVGASAVVARRMSRRSFLCLPSKS